MDTNVMMAAQDCEAHLNEMAKNFKPGAKLTFIARTPGNDEADFILSIDDLDEAIKALERRRGAQSSAPADVRADAQIYLTCLENLITECEALEERGRKIIYLEHVIDVIQTAFDTANERRKEPDGNATENAES